MAVEVTLEYQRVEGTRLSTGRLLSKEGGLIVEEGEFEGLEFKAMIAKLHDTTKHWPDEEPVDIVLKRTDHAGLVPYKLDAATVTLIRGNPAGAVQALSVPDRSPSGEARKAKEANVPTVLPAIRVGADVLADAFGDQLYFKVRGHELECPGCGFWSAYTAPSLLNATERAGASFKTTFVCGKRCRMRLLVTCNKEWGYVDTTQLLEGTACAAFYFPRAWNLHRPWATRDRIQLLFNHYKEEKEKVT